ncbi:diacylglycerol kinase [Bifidobacterium sp. BRDM6]|uniref:Diacylglycerol kinase n=2 Tax=Bifidobacterium choloepi TaxID=2614131 RepID=A0A6I5N022_9BIFI|nr:diacylglycerol kinase family protein [Bifidobacterium choloepi]NEG69836.1 diacylglycerol kinase [Bifidobacterium choloepi]
MTSERKTVAVIGNPSSAKGEGARASERVLELLRDQGDVHGFDVIDLTGDSFDGSTANARERWDDYDYLVVVGGDGMISLGVNVVGGTGRPLGVVAIGSGNDFARGLGLPVNRLDTAVEGIVGAIVHDCHVEVDLGHVRSLAGGTAVDTTTGDAYDEPKPVNRYYAGMLSCGLDARVNDLANHSHLPNGSLRYLVALIRVVLHLTNYGFHIRTTLADGSASEYDLATPLLTVANSRHIGGGIEVSPYSRFNDGMLDLVWLERKPTLREVAVAIRRAYCGRILSCPFLGWQRVRDVRISRGPDGDEPPILMADGEYVGTVPVEASVVANGLRLLVPPAVREVYDHTDEADTIAAIHRDGRDPLTGKFLAGTEGAPAR